MKKAKGEKVITPKARLSFPNLFRPDQSEQGGGKYSATLLFDKADPIVLEGLKNMKRVVKKLAEEAFGGTEGIRLPFRDGNEKTMDGYADKIFITAKSKYRPGVVAANPNQEIDQEGELYPGCWVRASLVPFAYDRQGNKGISFNLNHIQKIGDGDALGGGRTRAQDDFDAVNEETPFEEDEDDFLKS